MVPNLIDNPFHFFHLIYFEDFINVLKKDYHTKRIYLKKISSSSNLEDVTNETDYIKSIFQHFRKEIVNKILQDVTSLSKAEAEEHVHNIFSLLNNYKEKTKILSSKEDYTNEILNEIKYLIEFIQINYKDLLEEIEIKKNTPIYFNTGDESTPFKFLEDLLFSDGFERLKKSFGFKTVHTKNYFYLLHIENGYVFESWLLKSDISSQMDFDKYGNVVADYYTYAGLEIINKKQSEINFKQYLHNQLEKLYTYYLKKEDLNTSQFKLINNSLINIVSTLYAKYKSFNTNHKLYRIIIEGDDIKSSNFKPKHELKLDLFNDLYYKSEELEIFKTKKFSKNDFLDILVFRGVADSNKIKFKKSNPYVAYYLKSLELFFDNLTPLSIEKSKLFLNKQGKLITAQDLYTASSRGNIEKERLKMDIDSMIAELSKKYIK